MVQILKSGNKIISCGNGGSLCDVEIRAPYDVYSDRIQDIHIKVIHSLVDYIELSMQEQLKTIV
jgi:phosphoheptose isomerase